MHVHSFQSVRSYCSLSIKAIVIIIIGMTQSFFYSETIKFDDIKYCTIQDLVCHLSPFPALVIFFA